MNWLNSFNPVFEWAWRNSLQATPLILVVFTIHKLLGKRLTAGMRYALSLLVLVGLLLPVIPRSPFSLGNLFPARTPSDSRPQVLWSGASPRSAPETDGRVSSGRVSAHPWLSLSQAAGLLWLAGLAGLSGIASWRYLKWRRLINRARPITDPGMLALLDQAKRHMGVRRPVTLSAVEQLSSPAVFGARQVQVLLPQAVLEQLNPAELRLVLLHELAHVRRNDLLLNWVLMGVQFLHWFNPLVWLALHRIRSDCELVCDALVLKGIQGRDRLSYGQVLLKLTEGLPLGPRPFSGAVPVVSTKGDIKRRIIMIRHYREAGTAARLLTATLIVGLGCLTLTRARERATEPKPGAPGAAPLLASATNNGMMLPGGVSLSADRLTYDPFTGIVEAAGHVRLSQTQQNLSAERLSYNASSGLLSAQQPVTGITITYVGPRLVNVEQILAQIHVKVGDRFSPGAVDEDVRNLYATGQFYNVRVATVSSPAGVNLTYTIQCSPRLVAINFNGNSKFDDENLLKRINSRIGGLFNERKLFADSQAIQRMYQEAGYPDAAVKYTYELDQPAAEAKATFAIAETASTAAPVFQLRLVVDTPTAESEPVTLITRHGDQSYTNVIHVQKTVLLDQTALTSAKAGTDSLGHPIIDVTLTDAGKARFAEVTRQNLGKRLAIFIGGTVYQAPVIRTEIAGGKAQITGDFTKAEAQDLARKINDAIGR